MLTQNNRSEKQTESENTTLINRIMMWCPYTSNNTCQDTQNINYKTYRIKKLKFPEIRTKDHTQTHTLTRLTTRYENRTETVPKPYRNTKKHTLRYGFNDRKRMSFQEIADYGDNNFTHQI